MQIVWSTLHKNLEQNDLEVFGKNIIMTNSYLTRKLIAQ